MSIKHWHEEERPREKLMRHGARALSLAELLAILLGSGSKEISAVDLAKEILEYADYDLSRLENMSLERLQDFKGVGPAKAVVLSAAFELGRRRAEQQNKEIKQIKTAADVFRLMKPYLENLNHEEFWVIYLRKNNLLGMEKLMSGGWDFSMVDLRMLWKRVLEKGATAIILAHNHPSGDVQPSRADIDLTRKIKEAGELFSVRLLDHLIIAGNEYQSVMPYL